MMKFQSSKGFILPLLGILLVIVMVGGGVYFLRKNSVDSLSPSPLPSSSPLTTISTANWKLFSNPQKLFIFKYPDDWSLVEDNNKIDVYSPSANLVNGTNITDVISIVSASGLEFNAEKKEETTVPIAGQNVRRIEGTEIVSNKGTLIHVGPVSKNGQSFMLVYTSGSQSADPNALVIFNSLISTFQFTQ